MSLGVDGSSVSVGELTRSRGGRAFSEEELRRGGHLARGYFGEEDTWREDTKEVKKESKQGWLLVPT